MHSINVNRTGRRVAGGCSRRIEKVRALQPKNIAAHLKIRNGVQQDNNSIFSGKAVQMSHYNGQGVFQMCHSQETSLPEGYHFSRVATCQGRREISTGGSSHNRGVGVGGGGGHLLPSGGGGGGLLLDGGSLPKRCHFPRGAAYQGRVVSQGGAFLKGTSHPMGPNGGSATKGRRGWHLRSGRSFPKMGLLPKGRPLLKGRQVLMYHTDHVCTFQAVS